MKKNIKFYQVQVYIVDTWFVEYTCKTIKKAKFYLKICKDKYNFGNIRIVKCILK